jgi:hypothetical protein
MSHPATKAGYQGGVLSFWQAGVRAVGRLQWTRRGLPGPNTRHRSRQIRRPASAAFLTGLGGCPFPFGAVTADGCRLELASRPGLLGVFNGKDNLFALDTDATQRAADSHFALLVSFDRDVVHRLPFANRADGQTARDGRDAILFGLMYLALGVLHSGSRRSLNAKTDSGDDTGVLRHAMGDRGSGDAGTSGGILGRDRGAARQDRGNAEARRRERQTWTCCHSFRRTPVPLAGPACSQNDAHDSATVYLPASLCNGCGCHDIREATELEDRREAGIARSRFSSLSTHDGGRQARIQ